MDWSQILTIISANIALFFWFRTESNAHRRQMHEASELHRKQILNLINEISVELKEFHRIMCPAERGHRWK